MLATLCPNLSNTNFLTSFEACGYPNTSNTRKITLSHPAFIYLYFYNKLTSEICAQIVAECPSIFNDYFTLMSMLSFLAASVPATLRRETVMALLG